MGATGMRAHYFENAMAELMALTAPAYSELMLRRALRRLPHAQLRRERGLRSALRLRL